MLKLETQPQTRFAPPERKCIFQRTDVSLEAEVRTAVAAAQKEFGQSIDVLANVAGIAHESPAHLLDLADWNRILTVNLTSMFLMCKARLTRND